MQVKEVESRMYSIAQAVIKESELRLSALPQGAVLEKKALQIRRGMADFCQRIVRIGYTIEDRELAMEKCRAHLLTMVEARDDCSEGAIQYIQNCSDGEAVYLRTLLFIRERFADSYAAELEKARQYGDDENIFKLEIQLETVNQIMEEWREFGRGEGFNFIKIAGPINLHAQFMPLQHKKAVCDDEY